MKFEDFIVMNAWVRFKRDFYTMIFALIIERARVPDFESSDASAFMISG